MTENISLTLKTTQINSSLTYADYALDAVVSTSTGQISKNRTCYIWYNVNIRNLLDPIYNKYNKFNISLNNVITSTQGSAVITDAKKDDRQLQVKMSGLQWLSSYNQTYQRNDPNKVIKLIQLSTLAYGTDSFHFTEQYHTFLKGSEIVDITINLHNVSTDTNTTTNNATTLLGHMIFNFNIQGVPEDLNDRLQIKQKSTAHVNNVSSLR